MSFVTLENVDDRSSTGTVNTDVPIGVMTAVTNLYFKTRMRITDIVTFSVIGTVYRLSRDMLGYKNDITVFIDSDGCRPVFIWPVFFVSFKLLFGNVYIKFSSFTFIDPIVCFNCICYLPIYHSSIPPFHTKFSSNS